MGRRSRVGDNIWHPKSNKAFFFPFTPKKRTGGNSTWFSVTIGTTIIYRVPLWARVFSIHDTSYNNSSVIRTVLVASIRQPAHTSLNKSGTVWAHVTKRRIDFVLRITGSFRKQRQQEAPETSFHMSHFYFSVCLCLLITIDRATPAEEEHGYHVPYGYKMLLSLKKKKNATFSQLVYIGPREKLWLDCLGHMLIPWTNHHLWSDDLARNGLYSHPFGQGSASIHRRKVLKA